MIRIFLSMAAIMAGSTLIGALAGGILAGQLGAELGVIVGALLGLAIGFRYSADMTDIADAQRDMQEAYSLKDRLRRRRGRRDPFGEAARRGFLRDRRGEIWHALATKRRERLARSPLSRYASQRHHDLELSDIGIRRKSKPKR